MQLDVRLKGMSIGKSLREHVVGHIEASLRRFARRIRGVTICLGDTNGPRGGVDKNCQSAVHLNRGGTIRSGRTDADLIAAINLATERVTCAVVRRLERKRRRAARTKSWIPCED